MNVQLVFSLVELALKIADEVIDKDNTASKEEKIKQLEALGNKLAKVEWKVQTR